MRDFFQFKDLRNFLFQWQRECSEAYLPQWGLYFALPVVWGCMDAFYGNASQFTSIKDFLFSGVTFSGFLGMAYFLEGRWNRRIVWQCGIFIVWIFFLNFHFVTEITAFQKNPQGIGNSEYITGRIIGRPKVLGGGNGIKVAWQGEGKGKGKGKGFNGSSSRERKGYSKISLTVKAEFEGHRLRIILDPPSFDLIQGQKIAIHLEPLPPRPKTNPGQFDYANLLRSQGVVGLYAGSDIEVLEKPNRISGLVNFLHDAIEKVLKKYIPPDQWGLVMACVLGSEENVEPDLANDFRASGMLHILAISGQHIGLIALFLLAIFSLLRLPHKAAFLFTGILLIFYVPICGSSISVIRSVIMFWCFLLPVLAERPGAVLNNLGWAIVGCLIFMPYQILSLGFQLSFVATFFLILYSKPLNTWFIRLEVENIIAKYFISTLFFSIFLYFANLPILAATVHTIAPISLIGNLATIVLSSGLLIGAFLTMLFHPLAWIGSFIPHVGDGASGLWEYFASAMGAATGGFAKALTYSVHHLSEAPGAAQSLASLPWFWTFVLFFFLLSLPTAMRMGKGWKLILIAMTIFTAAWAGKEVMAYRSKPWQVAFLDVGQGDGAVCILPQATILIDAGPVNAGKNIILPYLRFRGIAAIDEVILTHPDLDHYGGLAEIIEHFPVKKVLYPGIESDAEAWISLRVLLDEKHIPMEAVHRGEKIYQYENLSFTILSPEGAGQFFERNDNSVVALLEQNSQRILFTGDMEGPAQEFLREKNYPNLNGVILKVPHHGSDRSNPPWFLDWIHPEKAILSAGRKNRFGHPGPNTVDHLASLGSKTFLTAKQGAIIYSDEKCFWDGQRNNFMEVTGQFPMEKSGHGI